MITNFQKQSRKDDVKIIICLVIAFLFVVWLVCPPTNKFLQLCFWGNNTKFFFSKMVNSNEATEYLLHRNNAIYLAKMYPKKKLAIAEMDKAISTLPSYASKEELESLYRDRAEIKLFLGDEKGALSDYLNSSTISFNDNLKVAILFRTIGNYREAMTYCNAMTSKDPTAYSGFACMADIYVTVGRPDVALKVWNLAIDRNPRSARAYADRALIKKSLGDLSGYNNDVSLAKQYSSNINLEASFIEETLHPKILKLSVR